MTVAELRRDAATVIHDQACACGRTPGRCGPQWRAAAAVVVDQVTEAVKSPRKRPKRYVEVSDFIAMVGRLVLKAGERASHADPDDLAALVRMRADVDAAIVAAVIGLRRSGFTWKTIGEATGTSKEAAVQKWAKAATAAGATTYAEEEASA